MKKEEKIKAIALREQGLAITKIASELGVSKASVSVWVRGIILSQDQLDKLHSTCNRYKNALLGAKIKREIGISNRLKFQTSGREKAKELNWLHVAGCMLYWGEGAKTRNCCKISNSDPCLLLLFIKFLYQCYDVTSDQIKVTIYAHTTVNSIEHIELYWQKILNLPRSCFYKSVQNKTSIASKNKKPKDSLPYGTVHLSVKSSTKIVQSIFGAIQEYCKNDIPKFLG